MGDHENSWFEQIGKYWNILADAAAVVLGIIGTFLYPPPTEIAKDNEQWLGLAKFIIAGLLGLLFVFALRWNRKSDAGNWWITGLIFLALSVGAFFAYNHLTTLWTCPCFDGRVVIGRSDQKTELGRSKNPDTSCRELLEDNQCIADRLWRDDSIKGNRFILAAMYIACMPLFTICIVAIIQAIFCMLQNE